MKSKYSLREVQTQHKIERKAIIEETDKREILWIERDIIVVRNENCKNVY